MWRSSCCILPIDLLVTYLLYTHIDKYPYKIICRSIYVYKYIHVMDVCVNDMRLHTVHEYMHVHEHVSEIHVVVACCCLSTQYNKGC